MALRDTDPALEVATPLLREVLGQLTYLQESLSDLQDQVQQSIQQVELALNPARISPMQQKTFS